jgi:hypothetical protein
MKASILLVFGMVFVLSETINCKSITDGGDGSSGSTDELLKLQDDAIAVKDMDNLEHLLQLAIKHMIENRIGNEDENDYYENNEDNDDHDDHEDNDEFSRITNILAKYNRKYFSKRGRVFKLRNKGKYGKKG